MKKIIALSMLSLMMVGCDIPIQYNKQDAGSVFFCQKGGNRICFKTVGYCSSKILSALTYVLVCVYYRTL